MASAVPDFNVNRELGLVLSALRMKRGRSTERGGFMGFPAAETVRKMETGFIPGRTLSAVCGVVAGLHEDLPLTPEQFRTVADAARLSVVELTEEVERMVRERTLIG
jgi:hypothetical protein